MTVLLTTAYWPNLHYFYHLLHADTVWIEQHENYQKQSFRNRTHILSANGLLPLSIPVQKRGLKELTKDLHISYGENWQMRHWRAIISAYKNSPYFEYFEEEIAPFYTRRTELLLDYNQEQLRLLFKLLKLKKQVSLTPEFKKEVSGQADLRFITQPKNDFNTDEQAVSFLNHHYYQTFGDKFGFTPNLSILDLLFNTGLESMAYLGGNSPR